MRLLGDKEASRATKGEALQQFSVGQNTRGHVQILFDDHQSSGERTDRAFHGADLGIEQKILNFVLIQQMTGIGDGDQIG